MGSVRVCECLDGVLEKEKNQQMKPKSNTEEQLWREADQTQQTTRRQRGAVQRKAHWGGAAVTSGSEKAGAAVKVSVGREQEAQLHSGWALRTPAAGSGHFNNSGNASKETPREAE